MSLRPRPSDAIAGFEWDAGNVGKCGKHGVAREEIEALFRHPHRIAPDVLHSVAETRFLAIGRGSGSRPIFVVFTLRDGADGRLIRPISARYMHRKEIARHEQAAAASDQ
ncbi:MAG: BrnT family toxin [Alphaproteobacteria bacterium]|nr:BrnT family toxin [Alphaproteobacteria bacterium]